MTVRQTSFPKTSRLKLASDFRNLLRNAKSFRENGLVIYFRKSNTSESRLGIIVSKRVFKQAVDRNKTKRLIREFYRKEKKNIILPNDIVIRVLEDHNLFKLNNLQKTLKQLFIKSGVIASEAKQSKS